MVRRPGTSLVKDINPGPVGSNIRGMTAFDGLLLFFANDGVHGNELWKSNGKAHGTTLVDDITPGSESSNSYHRSVHPRWLRGKLYFQADDGTNGKELWETNGTTAGTTMVSDINAGPHGLLPLPNSRPTNGKLYFEANNGAARL